MRFTRKRRGLELRVVISANINSTIANILSPNLTLYDLQKLRYIYGEIAATHKKGRGRFGIFRCTQKIDARAKFFHNPLNELFQLSKLIHLEMHTGLWQALRVIAMMLSF